LAKNLLKYGLRFLERCLHILTVNISSSLAFRRASLRCRTTRNAIVRWSYTRCDSTRYASWLNAVALSSAEATKCAFQQCPVWPSLGGRVPLFAKGALLRNTRCSFSKIRNSLLRNMRSGSPQYAFWLSAISVLPLRNKCSGSPQFEFWLYAIFSGSPQYVFHLSAIRLPPLRNTSSASPQ
jgi:hypothetical protein